MTLALVLLAAWCAIGVVVAARAVPWRDVSFHAPWARIDLDHVSPRSLWADRVFFLLAAVLWPFAARWRRLGYFDPPAEENGPDS